MTSNRPKIGPERFVGKDTKLVMSAYVLITKLVAGLQDAFANGSNAQPRGAITLLEIGMKLELCGGGPELA